MSSTSNSKLRRPNFSVVGRVNAQQSCSSSSSRGGIIKSSTSSGNNNSAAAAAAAAADSSLPLLPAGQLANYTRQCHQRLLASSAHIDANVVGHDVNGDIGTGSSTEEQGGNSEVTSTTTANSSNRHRGNDINNSSSSSNHKKNNDDTSMDQCITLLEPSLKTFQSSCIKNDNRATRRRKKQSKKKRSKQQDETSSASLKNSEIINNMDDDADATIIEEDIEDEIPPQLLRLARFFPYRWLPMKRALLRPPPPPPPPLLLDNDDTTNESNNAVVVEVSIHYRLRLAKACWKKGLVAAAEYESLKVGAAAAFDNRTLEGGEEKEKKRGRSTTGSILDGNGSDVDVDDGDLSSKRYKNNNSGGGGQQQGENTTTNLMEQRVRLSFMRLPTDAILPERSLTAWRHVREMVLECCAHWEKKNDNGNNLQDDDALSPVQVADWAMTCWTALLLSQGMECFAFTANHQPIGNNSVASIEKHLATLLSNRSLSNNPTLPLARAVAIRIDNLLSPSNLQSLNGVHMYSLGRLLASFHSRNDSEMHIVTSIVNCSLVGSGMMGLEQLSRLLAVYSCCTSATSPSSADDLDDATTLSRRTTVNDLEGRLRAKLDDGEIVKRIALADSTIAGNKARDQREMSFKAKSFLEAVFCATAHLVKNAMCKRGV